MAREIECQKRSKTFPLNFLSKESIYFFTLAILIAQGLKFGTDYINGKLPYRRFPFIKHVLQTKRLLATQINKCNKNLCVNFLSIFLKRWRKMCVNCLPRVPIIPKKCYLQRSYNKFC